MLLPAVFSWTVANLSLRILIFRSLSTFRCASLNKPCLSSQFQFHSLAFILLLLFFKFLLPNCHLWGTCGILAQWRQGRAGPGSVGVSGLSVSAYTMPALQSVSSVLRAKYSISLTPRCRLPSSAAKVRGAQADKESFISHHNNDNPSQLPAST